MRNISVGMTRIKHNHHLVKAEKGIGRRKGNYVCECGKRFTGVNHYEIHRADARKIEKENG